jgi:hypothetical protein
MSPFDEGLLLDEAPPELAEPPDEPQAAVNDAIKPRARKGRRIPP